MFFLILFNIHFYLRLRQCSFEIDNIPILLKRACLDLARFKDNSFLFQLIHNHSFHFYFFIDPDFQKSPCPMFTIKSSLFSQQHNAFLHSVSLFCTVHQRIHHARIDQDRWITTSSTGKT